MAPNGLEKPQKTKKGRKARAGLSLKKVDLEKLHKQLKNCLARDTKHLLVMSHRGKLGKEDTAALVNYLKLMKDLQKKEEEDLLTLSDEELEKLARGET